MGHRLASDHSDPAGAWPWLRRRVREVRAAIVLFVLAAVLDPGGVPSATERLTQEVFLTATSWLYERPFTTPDGLTRTGSAPITVVLIDEETVRQRGGGTVLTDRDLAMLLRVLRCAEPIAVFVDVSLVEPRPDEGAMAASLLPVLRARRTGELGSGACRGRDSPLPTVYFADEPDAEDPRQRAHPGIRSAAPILPIGWTAPIGVYQLRGRFAATSSGNVLDSGCAEPGADLVQRPGLEVVFPALELWRRLVCAERPASGPDLGDFPHQMVVAWGWRQNDPPTWFQRWQRWPSAQLEPGQLPAGEAPNLAPPPSLFALLFRLAPGLRRLLDPDGSPTLPPYTPWLTAEYVLKAAALGGAREALVGDALRGKAVLVGYAFRGSSDKTISPVHGVLPGVFLHAMALDNLWRWQDRVWREIDATPAVASIDLPPTLRTITGVLVACTLGAAVILLGHVIQRLLVDLGWPFPPLSSVLALFVLVLPVALGMAWAWSLAPVNWLGLLLFIVVEKVLGPIKAPAEPSPGRRPGEGM